MSFGEGKALPSLFLSWLTGKELSPCVLDELDENDWQQLIKWCKDHRLAPLIKQTALFKAVEHSQFQALINRQTKRQAFRQLQIQRELIHLDKILNQHDIPYKILKGPALAFGCYPKPELRPMRDIDIIVPQKMVLKAFNVLLESGCSRLPDDQASPESKAEFAKHLPAILGISQQVLIEVHSRVFNDYDIEGMVDFSEKEAFWEDSSTMMLAGRSINIESPSYLFVHLIFHSVYEHNLNNGPLILFDLYYLLNTYQLCWKTVYRLIDELNMQQGVDLLWSLQKKYLPVPSDNSNFESIRCNQVASLELMQAIENLILINLDDKYTVLFVKKLQQSDSRRSFWLRSLFPPKLVISGIYGVSVNSKVIYFYYVRYLFRLLFMRGPSIITSFFKRFGRRKSSEIHHLQQLHSWLKQR